MVWFDILCQRPARTQFETRGTLHWHRGGINLRKPFWLVAIMGFLSLATAACITFIVADLSGLAPPIAAAIGFLAMTIYAVLAHLLRPEPNVDNLGWFGMMNSPFQINDNINRWLWQLTVLFAPGRLIAMGFVDVCTFIGIIPERTEAVVESACEAARNAREIELTERAETRFSNKPKGVQPLDSMRFMNPDSK